MTYKNIYDKLMTGSWKSIGYVNKEYVISKSKNIVNKTFEAKGEVTVAYKATVIKHEISKYVKHNREKRNNRILKVKRIFK